MQESLVIRGTLSLKMCLKILKKKYFISCKLSKPQLNINWGRVRNENVCTPHQPTYPKKLNISLQDPRMHIYCLQLV